HPPRRGLESTRAMVWFPMARPRATRLPRIAAASPAPLKRVNEDLRCSSWILISRSSIGRRLTQCGRNQRLGGDIGHLDGKPFSAAKLAAYLACPRTSALRRLDALAKMQIIERRGTRYYLHEQRFNSDTAIKSHDRVRRIVLKAARQLSEMDTLGS